MGAFMAPEILRRIDVSKLGVGFFEPSQNSNGYALLSEDENKASDDLFERDIESDVDHHATSEWAMQTTVYDESVDVFAFGAVLFEVGFLLRVFDDLSLKDIFAAVTRAQRMQIPSYAECQRSAPPRSGFYIVSEAVYDAFVDLMRRCRAHEPTQRPTFEEIVEELEHIEHIRCGGRQQ